MAITDRGDMLLKNCNLARIAKAKDERDVEFLKQMQEEFADHVDHLQCLIVQAQLEKKKHRGF